MFYAKAVAECFIYLEMLLLLLNCKLFLSLQTCHFLPGTTLCLLLTAAATAGAVIFTAFTLILTLYV